jgi:hypothetical protein
VSNADASVAGAGNFLAGLWYGGKINITGAGNVIKPAPRKVEGEEASAVNLNPYKPGGSVARSGVAYTEIKIAQCVNGIWTTTTASLPSGVIYVPCAVVITGTGNTRATVIAATATIKIQAAGFTLNAIGTLPNMISTDTISVSGASVRIQNEVRTSSALSVSGAGGSYGCLVGSTVTISGSNNKVRGDCTIKRNE